MRIGLAPETKQHEVLGAAFHAAHLFGHLAVARLVRRPEVERAQTAEEQSQGHGRESHVGGHASLGLRV